MLIFILMLTLNISSYANHGDKSEETSSYCFGKLTETDEAGGLEKLYGALPFVRTVATQKVITSSKLTPELMRLIVTTDIGEELFGAKSVAREEGDGVKVVFWPGEGRVSHSEMARAEVGISNEVPVVEKAWGFQLTAEERDGELRVTEIHIDSSLTSGYRKEMEKSTLLRAAKFLRAVYDAVETKSDDCQVFFLNGALIDPNGVLSQTTKIDITNR